MTFTRGVISFSPAFPFSASETHDATSPGLAGSSLASFFTSATASMALERRSFGQSFLNSSLEA